MYIASTIGDWMIGSPNDFPAGVWFCTIQVPNVDEYMEWLKANMTGRYFNRQSISYRNRFFLHITHPTDFILCRLTFGQVE